MPNCELCGEPMPEGETMFKYHGYSGPCPKPPLIKPKGFAEKYRQEHGDSNQHIRESDLEELRARMVLAEAVADKATALMRTAGVIKKDKVSVVSFHPHMFNALADAIKAREAVFPDNELKV